MRILFFRRCLLYIRFLVGSTETSFSSSAFFAAEQGTCSRNRKEPMHNKQVREIRTCFIHLTAWKPSHSWLGGNAAPFLLVLNLLATYNSLCETDNSNKIEAFGRGRSSFV